MIEVEPHPLIGKLVSYTPDTRAAAHRGHGIGGKREGIVVGVTCSLEQAAKVVVRDCADEGMHSVLSRFDFICTSLIEHYTNETQ